MFIVFEGIDNSGKSTLSKEFLKYMNIKEGKDLLFNSIEDPEEAIVSQVLDFEWTKEPQFTTEEADRLNSPEFSDECKREALFFSDRIRHQEGIENRNIICDRYLWTGLAYAQKFSPQSFPLVQHLYTDSSIFIMPDLYVFVDTPVEVCDKRDPSVGLERLKDIREAYISTAYLVAPTTTKGIISVSAEGDLEASLKDLIEKFKYHLEAKN